MPCDSTDVLTARTCVFYVSTTDLFLGSRDSSGSGEVEGSDQLARRKALILAVAVNFLTAPSCSSSARHCRAGIGLLK